MASRTLVTGFMAIGVGALMLPWHAGCTARPATESARADPEQVLRGLFLQTEALPNGGSLLPPRPDKGIPSNPCVSSDDAFKDMLGKRLFGRDFAATDVKMGFLCAYKAPREIGIDAALFSDVSHAETSFALLDARCRGKEGRVLALHRGPIVVRVWRDGDGPDPNWEAVVAHVRSALSGK